MLAGKSWEELREYSRLFNFGPLCSPINIFCFLIVLGFIHSDIIQSCTLPSVLIIAILIFYLDYKPIPAGFPGVLHILNAKNDINVVL